MRAWLVLACIACSSAAPAPSDGGAQVPDAGVPRANGTIASWRTLAAMPEPRANHCSAVAAGHLLVFGGNHRPDGGADFVVTDAVHSARVLDGGGLGPWKLAGRMPSAASECTVAADGARVIVVDAIYARTSDGGKVIAATVDGDGLLAAWSVLGSVPDARRVLSSEAWVRGATLYAMADEIDPDGGAGGTLTLHAAAGASLGGWQTDAWLPEFRGQAQYAWTDRYVYVLGGYLAGATQVSAGVVGGTIGSDGTVGGRFDARALPEPTAFGEAVAVDDYLFVVGGRGAVFGGSGRSSVLSARAAGDGSLGEWTPQAPLPEGRTNHDMALGGSYLYVTGGAVSGPGGDTVLVAQVRF